MGGAQVLSISQHIALKHIMLAHPRRWQSHQTTAASVLRLPLAARPAAAERDGVSWRCLLSTWHVHKAISAGRADINHRHFVHSMPSHVCSHATHTGPTCMATSVTMLGAPPLAVDGTTPTAACSASAPALIYVGGGVSMYTYMHAC